MNAVVPLLIAAGCCAVSGCGGSHDETTAAAEMSPPTASAGTTDPAYDWETPGGGEMRGTRSIPTDFQSTKTLDATTRWLTWAMRAHGHAKPTIYTLDVNKAAFRGCTLELTVTETPGSGVTKISTYEAPLGEADLSRGKPRYSDDGPEIFFTREIRVQRQYIENGREKGARTEMEWSVKVPIRNQEQLPARVGLALVHASRLCGAKAR